MICGENLLVLARNLCVTENILKSKSFSNSRTISPKLHNKFNSIEDVIYVPCLIEIAREMTSHGVTDIGRIFIILGRSRLPQTVYVTWHKCKVEVYCQWFGLTLKICNNVPSCPNCCLHTHSESCICTFCITCDHQHSMLYKQWRPYFQMCEVLKRKTENYSSMGAERRRCHDLNHTLQRTNKNNTYAVTASQTQLNKLTTITTANDKPTFIHAKT